MLRAPLDGSAGLQGGHADGGQRHAAGGFGDRGTVPRGGAHGLEAAASLEANDTFPYLEACGDLLRCGPTGTNVNDLTFLFGL
jgi:hydroxypyruvate reductase